VISTIPVVSSRKPSMASFSNCSSTEITVASAPNCRATSFTSSPSSDWFTVTKTPSSAASQSGLAANVSFSARSFTLMPSVTVMVFVIATAPARAVLRRSAAAAGSPSSGLPWSSRSAVLRASVQAAPQAASRRDAPRPRSYTSNTARSCAKAWSCTARRKARTPRRACPRGVGARGCIGRRAPDHRRR